MSLLFISIILNVILILYIFYNNSSFEVKKNHVRFDIYSKNNKIKNAQMSQDVEKDLFIDFPIESKDIAKCYISSNRKERGKIRVSIVN